MADLDRRFVLAEQPVALAGGAVVIEKPRNADDLISESDFARDDRLPYWADLWPSATVLARFIESDANGVGEATGRRALELGCGLGLVTIAAMRAGWSVTATDYYEDALLFTARNALRATGRAPETLLVDWRALPPDLGAFDLVLAADVLYELPYATLVAETIRRTLAPRGRAVLADQGRVALGSFLEAAVARGLTHRIMHREARPLAPPAPEGSSGQQITIYELRHG